MMILLHECAMKYFSILAGKGRIFNGCKLLYLLEVDGTRATCLILECVPLTFFSFFFPL